MKYKKGQSGNPKGRPKGTPNRSTSEIREILHDLISSEIEVAPQLLNELETRDRLNLLVKLLPYLLPRMQSQELTISEPSKQDESLDLSVLTVEELETMHGILEAAEARKKN